MREILYIQAGERANYAGAHFWNTQEAYFEYPEVQRQLDSPQSFVDHDISFREGLGTDGSATYCPRLLIFDAKENFGALSAINELYSLPEPDPMDPTVQVIERPRVKPSMYHSELNAAQNGQPEPHFNGHPRYWSDFCRVFFAPRTIHPLSSYPFSAEKSRWDAGRESFRQYDEDHELMEHSFRGFAEECDNLQGVQATFDAETFGSFTLAMLERVNDDLPKKSIVGFPLLSALSQNGGESEVMTMTTNLTNALILRNLTGLPSTLCVPLRHSSNWSKSAVSPSIDYDGSPYHASAILSAQVETCTITSRTRNSDQSLDTLLSEIDPSGTTSIADLSGIFPLSLSEDNHSETFQSFSLGDTPSFDKMSTVHAVIRGDGPVVTSFMKQMSEQGAHFPSHAITSFLGYPIPSSYPQFFKPPFSRQTRIVSTFSALHTSTSTGATLLSYASDISTFARSGGGSKLNWDEFGRDEMLELAEDLRKLADGYETSDGDERSTELGEDEEYTFDL